MCNKGPELRAPGLSAGCCCCCSGLLYVRGHDVNVAPGDVRARALRPQSRDPRVNAAAAAAALLLLLVYAHAVPKLMHTRKERLASGHARARAPASFSLSFWLVPGW